MREHDFGLALPDSRVACAFHRHVAKGQALDLQELVDGRAHGRAAAPEGEQHVGPPARVENLPREAPAVAQELLRI